MEANPYSVPTSNPFGGSSLEAGGGITDGVLAQLRGTKGWVKLFAILCFLGGGMMALGGLVVVVMGLLGASVLGAAAGAAEQALAGLGGAAISVVIGGLYALFGLLYLYPGFKLWGYGTTIDDLLKDRSVVTLEKALNFQRSFWKFCGIVMVAILSLYVLVFVGAIVFGIVAAAAGGAALQP
jgi:hypothetical protein